MVAADPAWVRGFFSGLRIGGVKSYAGKAAVCGVLSIDGANLAGTNRNAVLKVPLTLGWQNR
jgi:hypothetical protein